MTELIEGLHFDFPANELKAHLKEKAEHHNERSIWYTERLKDLREGGVETDAQVTGGDPLSNLEHQAKRHSGRAEYFWLLSDHVIGGEHTKYRLTHRDMAEIELVSKLF